MKQRSFFTLIVTLHNTLDPEEHSRLSTDQRERMGPIMNRRNAGAASEAQSDGHDPVVMAPSMAKNVPMNRDLLVFAAGRAPLDVAHFLLQHKAAATTSGENTNAHAPSQSALALMWSLQSQSNLRGKWDFR